MEYKVLLTKEAEIDLDNIIKYILIEKKNKEAAESIMNDFSEIIKKLSHSAGSFKLCDNLRLKELGYRRLNFSKHDYFILYRIQQNKVFIDKIFHFKQDYENKIK